MSYEKTDAEGFLKDKKTGAIINTNKGELSSYRRQKQFYREFENMKSAIFDMQKRIEELEKKVDE